ncbi:MAG: glutamate racemase [Tepidisphaeraceae bacterium]|jgi:glutamate racemase
MKQTDPIAVLDSGLGGLTVVSALRRVLPAEDLIYFGDTAHLPYGNKSPAAVCRFVRQIVRFLEPMNPKHLVIACNTATALAMSTIAGEFPGLSISGVIEPGARAAVAAAGARRLPAIGVIATEATVRSKAYERAIFQRRNLARVMLRPTPLLVPMIEEGRTGDDPLVETALRQYLQSMILRKVDVLVLGCTHYPLLKGAIAKVIGPKVRLIDSAEQCAQDVVRRLERKGLLREPVGSWEEPVGSPDDTAAMGESPSATGTLRTFVTDDPERFAMLASRFLEMEIEPPTLVKPLDAPEPSAPVVLRAAG